MANSFLNTRGQSLEPALSTSGRTRSLASTGDNAMLRHSQTTRVFLFIAESAPSAPAHPSRIPATTLHCVSTHFSRDRRSLLVTDETAGLSQALYTRSGSLSIHPCTRPTLDMPSFSPIWVIITFLFVRLFESDSFQIFDNQTESRRVFVMKTRFNRDKPVI